MAVDRFLGAGFASVHGPADPRAMLLWVLNQGFAGLWPAPAPRNLEWAAMRRVVDDLPFRFGGVRVSGVQDAGDLREAGLASSHQGERLAAIKAVEAAIGLAVRLGCPRVLLEPGVVSVSGEVPEADLGARKADWSGDRARALLARRRGPMLPALDAACRSLHHLCREYPDIEFCLTTSRNALGLGDAQGLAAIFEDLGRYRLGYWHDTVAAACRQEWLAEDPGKLLENFSNRLSGMTLGDFGGGEKHLPPGAGGVDYPLLSAYRQRSAKAFSVVVELDPGVDPGELAGVQAFLTKFGL
jgi:sugar phosphate isomerase/epimerase